MATYTKSQFKKRIETLKDQLSDLRLEFDTLKEDLECEANDIEPYEGRYELTELQEERKAWLESTAETIERFLDSLEETEYELDEIED